MAGDDDLARTLSLPYLAGSREAAGGAVGVVTHEAERAWPGVNLYISGHAPEAILIDMNGRLLHRWRCPFERALPERQPTAETDFFRRAQLLPSGDLVALFQGGGLVRLDRDSNVVWSLGAGTYNDLMVDADGSILVITKTARTIEEIDPESPVLEDFVTRVGNDGTVLGSISLLQAVLDAGLGHLLRPTDGADLTHSNTVTRLAAPQVAEESPFGAGRLLVSLREIDLLAVLDEATGRFTWTLQGPWHRQHEPVLLADGRVLLFDNLGAEGDTRVIEVDPRSSDILRDYRGPEGQPLDSPEAGSVAGLPNGNILITDTALGRALEVSPDGEIVWQFESPHRAGSRSELVAALFELVRVSPEAAAWVTEER